MTNPQEENCYNCKKCSERDNEDMVQCDVCDYWYHFVCVGVDSNVADVSWSCEHCKNTSSIANIVSLSSTHISSNYSTELTSTNMQGENQRTMPNSDAGVVQSSKATATVLTSSRSQITAQTPLVYTAPIMSSMPYMTPHYSFYPTTMMPTMNQTPNPTPMFAAVHNTYTQQNLPTTYFQPNCTSSHMTANAVQFSDSIEQQRNLELQKLEEEMQAKRQQLENKYKLLSGINVSTMPNNQIFIPNMGPTPDQIAARHAIPKQLPFFNGDPEDWPLFISSYENSTTVAGYSNAENLIRLQAALKGKAREIVKNKLILPQMVPEIIQTLRMCFGRPEHILERVIAKARSMPVVKDKLDALIEYAMCVRNICATMERCQLESHLSNPLLVKELLDKLPNNHKLSWAMCQKDERVPVVKAFSDWLYNMAEAASSVTPLFGKPGAAVNTHSRDEGNTKMNDNCVNNAVSTKCIVCKGANHEVPQCDVFKNMSLSNKWEVVKTKKMCRQCLRTHRRKCGENKECGVDGCTFKHNPLLHKKVNANVENSVVESGAANSVTNLQQDAVVNAHSTNRDESQTLFRIIPINVYGHKTKTVFAFLDEGSAVTLIEKSTFDDLGLEGESDPLCLRWTGDTTRMESDSLKATITISNVNNGNKFFLNDVHTVDNLGLSAQTIDAVDIAKRYTYLARLPIQSYHNATPTILIGADNWKLAIPLKIREGLWHQPIASKTRLGWTLQWCNANNSRVFPMNIHSCDCHQKYNELHDIVKSYFTLDSPRPIWIRSADDNNAIKILEQTSKKVNGNYEVGLLWRNKDVKLPESYNHAYNRLLCLEKKFIKDINLKLTIKLQIENLISKGYARKLTQKELKVHHDKTWYLPIFVVKNPNKPEKIRLVWDAAAKSNGISLNDFLMTGPDMLNPLVEILLKFRVGRTAICGDISEMFHRINVRESDMHAQRFLWRDAEDDINKPIKAIQENHYVDDFIASVDDEAQAIELATQVQNIHAAAGFKMHNWTSSSEKVLKQLHNSNTTEQTMKDWGTTTKILVPTKREVLQVLMSIFDPLGFVSCYTIGLKILIQEIWRAGIGWDEQLTDELNNKWCRWQSTIGLITAVRIPRCYSLILSTADEIQLHTFVDAGENAYAAVSYLRVKKNNNVNVTLIAAKSKVAPLKPLSIPKLELQAAILGTRLAKTISQVHQIRGDLQFWWSDAKTVLKWLQMDPKKFQQFVMHRVGEILENTNVNQWRWVPTKHNPADFGTKVTTPPNKQAWFDGPDFLQNDENSWPYCDDLGPLDESEIKRFALVIEKVHNIELNIEYFSNWKRLYRAVATFILYCNRLNQMAKQKTLEKQQEVDSVMIKEAQTFLIKYAQRTEYNKELSNLKRGKPIERGSKLISLNVYLDKNDVIRCRGRAEYLNNHEDAIVLPENHHVTFLLVRHYHELFGHQSHETALNEIRSLFYIVRLRVLFRKVRRTCQWCKINSATPQLPQMAPMALARLAAFERPFTFVGLDYFGPMHVTVGRRREKRWGVIFTCLTLRAIHVEVAHSLDASSCIMAIRNFISRRGTPREFYSDNGTNFKAAEKILCSQLKNVNFSTIQSTFEQIKWKFNPPAAPHMGGAWERLVRSVKSALYSIFPSMSFTDESLKSALCEVEFTINCRPLTYVTLECSDDQAITPNHLLIGSSDGYKLISNENVDIRQRWYRTQEFADRFWRRWLKEYVSIISRRSKWFAKQSPIKIGDIVVIVDPELPRNSWPKGIVTDTVVAKDGQVRRATVKTKNSVLERPVAKLAVLDVSSGSESKLGPPNSFTMEGTVAANRK